MEREAIIIAINFIRHIEKTSLWKGEAAVEKYLAYHPMLIELEDECHTWFKRFLEISASAIRHHELNRILQRIGGCVVVLVLAFVLIIRSAMGILGENEY